MAYHAMRNRVPRWGIHINILTKLALERGIMDIKLRHRPITNIGHNKEGANNCHMGRKSKCLIVITTLTLLKTRSRKASFVTLKRSIKRLLIL
jgi:hypothetical protein